MANKLYEVLESRILLLDGGFGTMVQQYGFTEEDYRCLLYTSARSARRS